MAALLAGIIVTKKLRGKGIGSKLYNAFLKYAHELGVARVEWPVLDWNIAAIALYQKSGAKVLSDWRTVQMDKKTIQNYFKIS